MATSTITISGTKTGLPSGTAQINTGPVVNYTATGADTVLTPALGDNTIAVPTGSLGAIILPAVGSATLKLKGAAGDTGVTLHPTNPTMISFPAGTSSLLLNASAGGGTVEVVFI